MPGGNDNRQQDTQPTVKDTDIMAPLDLSEFCDGRRMEFPLGTPVVSASVMVNGVYLEETLDFTIAAMPNGHGKLLLRHAPGPDDQLVVMRVPGQAPPQQSEDLGARAVPDYEHLPGIVKNNISPEQWVLARRRVVQEDAAIPEAANYVNLKNGQILRYELGQRAEAPLIPQHDLAGGGGKDDTQFRDEPEGAHLTPSRPLLRDEAA